MENCLYRPYIKEIYVLSCVLSGSVESQLASDSLAFVFVYADTPEGAYPLSAVLMKLKKLAKMMPGFLQSP